jgi:hypothetical protein
MRETRMISVTLRTAKSLLLLLCVTLMPIAVSAGQPSARGKTGDRGLQMSPAVVCRSIEGYERYEKLPGAALTSDEKLLLYFRPTGYKTAIVDGVPQAHFTEDCQIRRRDDKVTLRQQVKLVEYKQKVPDASQSLFMRNSIMLKGLPPGEYEFVLILHDQVAKTPPAKQVVRFRIVPAKDPKKSALPGAKQQDLPAAEDEAPGEAPIGGADEPKG